MTLLETTGNSRHLMAPRNRAGMREIIAAELRCGLLRSERERGLCLVDTVIADALLNPNAPYDGYPIAGISATRGGVTGPSDI